MKRILTWGVAFLLLTSTGHAYTETDGDFINWSIFEMVWTGSSDTSNYGVGNIDTSLEPGNPFIRIETSAFTYGKSIRVLAIKDDFSWDPGSQGTIESVSMAIDHRFISSSGGAPNHGVEMIVFQDGNYYHWGIGYAESNSSWETLDSFVEVPGYFVEDDFALMIPGVGHDTSSHPDFSVSGAPIWFGFAAGAHISEVNVHDYDNYELTINSVPAPGAFVLLLSGLTGLCGISRRKRNL